jgi:flagellar hook-basal body complex protein FliE
MAIETVGSMNNLLKAYDADKWTKSSDLNVERSFKIEDAPDPFKAHEAPKSFSEMLAGSIGDVNSLQKEANTAIEKLATGKTKNLHETMLAVEKAEIAYKTMNQIRLKVIDAYKEVMRMQL